MLNTNYIDVVILTRDRYVIENHKDDKALKKALNDSGYSAKIVAWDDMAFDFSLAKVVIIRSCWDYQDHIEVFLRRMEEIARVSILVNDFEVIKYNCDKMYLNDLSNRGIDIVPSYFLKDNKALKKVLSQIMCDRVIVKPTVSASGNDTHLFLKSEEQAITQCVSNILMTKHAMIQPFFECVQTIGEKSIVVIDGEITFAMLKKPSKSGFLVHEHHGGTYVPCSVADEEKKFVMTILKVVPYTLAYMRIDLLYDDKHRPQLLELELIEPNLYLHQNEEGLKRLVEYLIRNI